ncbi:MAG: MMPL family transporter [Burkholderiaceae bacterium]
MSIGRAAVRRAWILSVWLVLMALAAISLRDVAVRQDLSQFMPTGADARQRQAVELLRDGPASRLVLIAIEGGTAAERARSSRALAGRLRDEPLLEQVANGASDIDPGALDGLFPYRYLLRATPPRAFEAEALREALNARLSELGAAVALTDARRLAGDPIAAFRAWARDLRPPGEPARQAGVWADPAHDRALLLARTAGSGLNAEQQQQMLDRLTAAFAATGAPPELRLRLAGNPIYAAQTRDSIRRQMSALSAAASLFVTILLWMGYRSLRLALLAALPLLSAGLAGAALVAAVFGQIHGITLVFGVTLIGVAIDYPIHLFSHLGQNRDPHSTIRRLWPTLRLGVLTTAIGYLAFARSDFAGLAQLGLFAAGGLLAAAAVTRWLLPSLLAPDRRWMPGAWVQRLAKPALQLGRPGAVLGLAALSALTAMLWWLSPPRWETDLRALSPLNAGQRALAGELQQALGGLEPSRLIVVRAATAEQALMRSEALIGPLTTARDIGLIGEFDLAARHLPSPQTQRERARLLPDRASLAGALAKAMQGLPFKEQAFAPFLDAVEQSRSLAPMTLAQTHGSALGERLQPLLGGVAGDAYALVMLHRIGDVDAFAAWWQAQAPADAELLDLVAISGEILDGFRDTTLSRWLLGLIGIVITITIGRRSLRAALTALMPTLLAALTTLGILGALDQRLSLFHLIALLLTVGIAIDYNLFFQRPEHDRHERLATLHSLSLCALSSASVFAILGLSPTPVLQAMGLTVAIGVVFSLLFALATARLLPPAVR